LRIHGLSGAHYQLESTTNLGDPNSWSSAMDLILTNPIHRLDWPNPTEPARFFRTTGPR
jgi:hypothetical protein